jgi:hypothetical protein
VIAVKRTPAPSGFADDVKKPGEAWLKKHPRAKRPKDYWSACLPKLAERFCDLCGYAAMLDPTGGTVDHYISFKTAPTLAYTWSNYRFASGIMNAIKKNADDAVLDPYDVGAGWFEISLPSLQLEITSKVPRALRAKAEYTLKRLRLRDGERVIRWRASWYDMYLAKELPLAGLRRVAPLLAAAVAKANAAQSKAAKKQGAPKPAKKTPRKKRGT